jgi:hypothetical protein
MDLKGMGCEYVERIHMAQDMTKWRGFLLLKKLTVAQLVKKFLTIYWTKISL